MSLQSTATIKLLKAALNDEPQEEFNSRDPLPGPMPDRSGAIESSALQADDAVPMGELAAIVTKLKGALAAKKGAAALVGLSHIRPGVAWEGGRFQRLLHGENPFVHSPESYGKVIRDVGPDIGTTVLRANGAQMLDEARTENLVDAFRHRLARNNTPYVPVRLLDTPENPFMSDALAYYRFNPRQIVVHTNNVARDFGDSPFLPELSAGIFAHEGQHAIDHARGNPLALSPQAMNLGADIPKTNRSLGRAGWLTEGKLDAWNNYVYGSWPDNSRKMRDIYERRSLGRGGWQPETAPASLARELRYSMGNNGFKGTNPYFAEWIRSRGHFDTPINAEMDLPVFHLAMEQARHGGEIGEWERALSSRQLDEARRSYSSPAVQVPRSLPEPRRMNSDARAGIAAALLGTVGIGSYEAGKRLGSAQAKQQAGQAPKEFVGPKTPDADMFENADQDGPPDGEGAGSVAQFKRLLKSEYIRRMKEGMANEQ